jgi:beta-glucanase (GH16 family)
MQHDLKRWIASAALALAAAGATPAQAKPWELVWRDEFDYTGQPDPRKWDYEEGYVRNEEQQYYMRRRLKNARVEGGRLILEAHRENLPNPRHRSGSERWQERRRMIEYTAASVITKGRFEFQYGRIEVRARLPRGRGVWPAIWTLGVNQPEVGWPRCGEIDIMEFVGHTPDTIHANVHWPHPQPTPQRRNASRSGRTTLAAPWEQFHVYAIEWTPDRIEFFVDDRSYHAYALDAAGKGPDNPFRKPHYLLLNFALGGTWGREVDDAALPQRFEVDYVRVHRSLDPAWRGATP